MGAANSKEQITLARSPRWQALLAGDLKVEDLDDEELLKARLKDKHGRISAKGVNVVPRQLHEALTRELVRRMNGKFAEQLDAAIETIVEIMNEGEGAETTHFDERGRPISKEKGGTQRLKAAIYVVERIMGKIESNTHVTIEATPWQEAVQSGELFVDLEEPGVIDVEVVDDLPTPARTRTRAPVRRRRTPSEEPG